LSLSQRPHQHATVKFNYTERTIRLRLWREYHTHPKLAPVPPDAVVIGSLRLSPAEGNTQRTPDFIHPRRPKREE
jgi:hypothetical protein